MEWVVTFVSAGLSLRRIAVKTKREAHILLRGHVRIYRVGRTYFIYN